MESDMDFEKFRKKHNAARRKQLAEQLKLQAEILCESHKETRKRRAVLNNMLSVILELLRADAHMNQEKRKALAQHFENSAFGGTPIVEVGDDVFDRDMIHINGSFAVSDLAKKMIWKQ
jgi:hypothetical protein